MSRPRDLADGEREAFRHGRGSWNDDHFCNTLGVKHALSLIKAMHKHSHQA